ncbi:T-cell surface glycoprotein CD8 alpha chain-like isoform X1 [Haemorhous mexicanus]|uniref:T-cell surface glycoprotein CD8 alpha chain-like isoform X1 n=1 Tax=Haemorhous mexicanus TaxID=30427 RepID=UPI0028BE7B15|nr:T-cell surface glycoprotein CD8 alpha chain-like isoform X1 [Haemorhous mexicanus]
MDTSPALLLLLTLGFCCPGIYGQSLEIKVRSPKDIGQLRVGQKLELECHTDRSSGASWIRQDRSGTLHFIVFISSLSRATFEGSQKTSTRFEASKDNTTYRLAVKSFTPQDEGRYFCVMILNQMLHFSPGQRAFLPATTAVAPSTPGPTTQGSTTEGDSCLKTPDPAECRKTWIPSVSPSSGSPWQASVSCSSSCWPPPSCCINLRLTTSPSRCTSGLKPQSCP